MLRAVTENVLLEIQKTFDFFKATAASDRIDRIVLSGGASRVEGFAEMLAERFDAPVEAVRSVQDDRLRREEVPGRRGRRRGADGGGRRRPRAATGGRPMIRINLLAVERERGRRRRRASCRPAQRVTIGASLDPARRPCSASAGGSGRSAQQSQTLDDDIAEGRDRDAAAALGARAGPEVRDAQGAAPAARHAHRAAAQGADRRRCTCSTRSARACPTGSG